MQIIIKNRTKSDLPDDLAGYVEEKVGKVTADLKEPTVCEVIFLDTNGPKGGVDCEVHITCTLPNVKNPVFVSQIESDFYKTIDLAAGKFRRALHNAKR